MTVEFDKETEGFVLNKLDSLTRIKTRSGVYALLSKLENSFTIDIFKEVE